MTSRFKKILASVLGQSSCCNDDGFPSVNLALKKILGEKLFNRLILSTPDRRQLVEEAARLKGVSEDELTKIIAEKLELPVFFKPKAIDLELLPSGITIRDLRRYGVFPLMNEDLISGIVCVDPAELSNITKLYGGTNIYLTNWKALLVAIEDSEQLYLRTKVMRENKPDLMDQQLIAKLLGRLLQEMEFKKSDSLVFEDGPDSVLYSFKDQDDLSWQGQIDHEIGRKLMEYLQYRIASNKPDLSFFGFGSLLAGAENGQIYIRRSRDSKIIMFPGTTEIFSNEEKRQHSRKILLIDDNQSYLDIMQGYLNKQGFQVTALTGIKSAKTFLDSARNNSPDLIISDLHLQDGTALTLLQELKISDRFSSIPFIVLSSDRQQENELKVLGLGADAFIAKNKDPRILALHIRRLLKYRAAA